MKIYLNCGDFMKFSFKSFLTNLLISLIVGLSTAFVIYYIAKSPLNRENGFEFIIPGIAAIVGLFVGIIFLLVIQFIQYKKNNAELIYRVQYIDSVTGAYNRNKFIIEVCKILKNIAPDKFVIAVLEINNFKVINELFGFDEGNKILNYIAYILKNNIYKNEVFARGNAGRFEMLLKSDSTQNIKARLEKIMDIITEYKIEGNPNSKFALSTCCGVYYITKQDMEDEGDREFKITHMLDRARIVLSEIRGKYINRCAFYDDEIKSRMIYENDMERALENKEFVVYIQPKYNLKTQTLTGGEALVRWKHATKGFLPPDEFIPLFEKNGFIIQLDMYVFENVCKMQKKWLDMGLNPVRISVNQSRLHLFKRDYVKSLKYIINKYDLPVDLIELEITENVVFESMEIISDVLKELREFGFTISMDDFGSGYSPLSMLKNLDVDVLKIDKSFLEETSNTKKGKDIVESIIDMAGKLGIETVAEGVETKEQVQFLQEHGCDIAQGYFYAMPMPIDIYEENELIKRKKTAQ